MADKEVKLIDTELLRTNIAQIAKACAKSDKQKALVGRILFMIENMPTVEAEPVKHGRWIKSEKQKHVEVTYECSECQHEVVGEYEKTPFCGGCGARMDGDKDNNVRNLTNEETAIYESWIESEAKDTGVNIMDGDGE